MEIKPIEHCVCHLTSEKSKTTRLNLKSKPSFHSKHIYFDVFAEKEKSNSTNCFFCLIVTARVLNKQTNGFYLFKSFQLSAKFGHKEKLLPNSKSHLFFSISCVCLLFYWIGRENNIKFSVCTVVHTLSKHRLFKSASFFRAFVYVLFTVHSLPHFGTLHLSIRWLFTVCVILISVKIYILSNVNAVEIESSPNIFHKINRSLRNRIHS